MRFNQRGLAPLLLLIAGLGVIVFTVTAGYAPFKDNLYSILYRKNSLFASDSIPYINHIISNGQSLSVGADGCPSLTTTQPFNNLSITDNTLKTLTSFRSLVEDFQIACNPEVGGKGVESISSAMANTISNLSTTPAYEDFVVSMHGGQGYPYIGLKKGTPPYQEGMAQIQAAKSAAQGMNRPYRVPAVTIIHGETDTISGTPGDQYTASIAEWQRDYESDAKALTGQFEQVPLFHSQTSSHTAYDKKTSSIPEAQLNSAENNTGKVYLVGPKYFLEYINSRGPVSAHLKNTSYRQLGEYYGKVIKKVIADKTDWKPLSPQKISFNGKIIDIKLNVPVAPIVIDTVKVAERPKRYPNIDKSDTKYGFEYFDNSASPANITYVEITGPDTIKITLDKAPNAADNPRLRYAHTGINNSIPGAFGLQTETPALLALGPASARGNIRDSDNTPSLYGNSLNNWLVQFDKSIPFNGAGMITARNSCRNNIPYIELEWDDYGNFPNFNYEVFKTKVSAGTEQSLGSRNVRNIGDDNLSPESLYRYRVEVKSGNNQIASGNLSLTTKLCVNPTPAPTSTPSINVQTVSIKKLVPSNPKTPPYPVFFFTGKQNEIDYLTARGWTDSGIVFKAPAAGSSGVSMASRMIKNDGANQSQITTWAADPQDISALKSQGFTEYPDSDFFAYLSQVPGSVPVTRLKFTSSGYNQTFYTFSLSVVETDVLSSQGWTVDKNNVFYIFPPDRQTATVTHVDNLIKSNPPYYANFYTSKAQELDYLLTRGWSFKGAVFKSPIKGAPDSFMASRMVLTDNQNSAQIHTWAASQEDIKSFKDKGFTESADSDFFVFLTQKAGTVPVTRLKFVSSVYSKTFYQFAITPTQINDLISKGWTVDKQNVFYVYPM